MMTLVESEPVQSLLDRVAGIDHAQGSTRTKLIVRDLVEATMTVIEKHDVDESEFWKAIAYLQGAAPEFGLIVPGLGLEHFLDLLMDRKDAAKGLTGGTPRTIEGPLYVEGSPLVENDADLSQDPDEDAGRLYMTGRVSAADGTPVSGAILHVWHANSKGFYSHFDPTGAQSPFNNRRRLKLGADGRYAFHSRMPSGYAVPPGGPTEWLMDQLGRHGKRPAHVHFFIEAPGFRPLTTQINFGDDPFAHDDFAFATREGLLPVPNRQGDTAHIAFDFVLQPATAPDEELLSARPRARADA